MNSFISDISASEYQEVVDVWEPSVRATHDFLQEEDIAYFKPLILEHYLDAVQLKAWRDEKNKILGFSGVADGNLEMLFIHPDSRGKGIGKTLLEYSITYLNVTKVDVNEQNEQAVGFYLKQGFTQIGRSEKDPTGKPYPILHLQLNP
ncbi:GNAT family N-acetyltransferase [Algoriphagus zhangzhouensis]|uniref:Putative acetyltransferase n=1 Tax=Algoriphagus zhangzhouensis TaxID=1073327 RepID=A0A1M7ZJA3_9BACT|nr:GNAT family N-acetyltransferase [Algoriphagus zhangzhouensis]TDY43588.1 putative acetyltransferase [Algoriphagus zhangzhouensis]SHO64968.1 putative acetyltransferase [Algoriphagus zhangzhouensis]